MSCTRTVNKGGGGTRTTAVIVIKTCGLGCFAFDWRMKFIFETALALSNDNRLRR